MKKYVSVVFGTVFLATLLIGPVYGGDKENPKGRFRLFNAEYKSTFVQKSKTTGFDEKKLFKIDTQTGETWMLIDVMLEGKDRKYWKKIEAEPDN
ncbi:hypothetical protein ACFL9U_12435 [Thermodesulfobacteriota bacterium]